MDILAETLEWINHTLSKYGIKSPDADLSWDVRPFNSIEDPFNVIEFKEIRGRKLRIVVHLPLDAPLLGFHYLRGILKIITRYDSSWDIVTFVTLLLCNFKKRSKERGIILNDWSRFSPDGYRSLIRFLPIVESLDAKARTELLQSILHEMKKSSRLVVHLNHILFNLVERSLDEDSYKVISFLLTEQEEDIPEIRRVFGVPQSSYYKWKAKNTMIINSYLIPNIWALGLMKVSFLYRAGSPLLELSNDIYWENAISFTHLTYLQGSFWYPIMYLSDFIKWTETIETDFIIELPFGNWTSVNINKISSYPIPPIELRYGFDSVVDTPTNDEVKLVMEMILKRTSKLNNLTSFKREDKRVIATGIKKKELIREFWILTPPRSTRTNLYFYTLDFNFNPETDLVPERFFQNSSNDPNLGRLSSNQWQFKISSYGIRVFRGSVEPLVILRILDEGDISLPFSSPHLHSVGRQNFHSGQTYRFDGSTYNGGKWDGHEKTLLRLRGLKDVLIKYK